jgi:mRNA interferase HicA
MKRDGLLRHLRRHGCILRREGKEHSLWENPQTGRRSGPEARGDFEPVG